MAQRRMFSKTITNSSSFITMPHSSQALYFQLGMNADDDGYCEHVMVMRLGAFQPDDLKILHAKGFVHVFDQMVLVIKDWKENNYIQKDRYTPSKYLETHDLNNLDTGCIQNVIESDTQVRLGKVRKGKNNTYSACFEEIWNQYPKKVNKPDAYIAFKGSVKTDQDVADIKKALRNYKIMLQKEDWRKPKDGCRFFVGKFWRSFVEDSTEYIDPVDELIEKHRKD